jgi:hypothetical protein
MLTKIALLVSLVGCALGSVSASAETWDVTCRAQDCFRNGWTAVGDSPKFVLEARCVNDDCRRSGWKSKDSVGTRIEVRCAPGGCFAQGWTSRERRLDGSDLWDTATCRGQGCLTHGWDVVSSYDEGGRVACNGNDCSRHGGSSYWRGRRSVTTCKSGDCYRVGWVVRFLDPRRRY